MRLSLGVRQAVPHLLRFAHGHIVIRNVHPERWPAGDPQVLNGPRTEAITISTLAHLGLLAQDRDDPTFGKYFHLAVDKRPGEELFDIRKDPDCLNNLANQPAHRETARQLRAMLEDYLTETATPAWEIIRKSGRPIPAALRHASSRLRLERGRRSRPGPIGSGTSIAVLAFREHRRPRSYQNQRNTIGSICWRE